MSRLTKEAWAKSSLRTKEVQVEELGGSVLIRELPAGVSADFSGLLEAVQVGDEQRMKIDQKTMEQRQFAYGVVDESGEPLFTEEEVAELQSKHGRAFRTVIKAIDDFSGIDKEAIEEAEVRFPGGGAAATNGREAGSDLAIGSDGPDRAPRVGA